MLSIPASTVSEKTCWSPAAPRSPEAPPRPDERSLVPSPHLAKMHVLGVKAAGLLFIKPESCSNRYLRPSLLQRQSMFVPGHWRGMWAAIPRFFSRQQHPGDKCSSAASSMWAMCCGNGTTHADLRGGKLQPKLSRDGWRAWFAEKGNSYKIAEWTKLGTRSEKGEKHYLWFTLF